MLRIILRYTVLCTVLTILYSKILQWTKGEQIVYLIYLTALIVPIVLYLALREMTRNHWNYRLPILQAIIVGLSITIISATLLTMINFGLTYWQADEELRQKYTGFRLVKYLFSYIKWYLIFAGVSLPLVYGILFWQLKRK